MILSRDVKMNASPRSGLSVTSAVLGVLSVLFILMGLSIPIGALGVITALLSRGDQELENRAKIGLALSLLGITIGICMLIWSYRMLGSSEFQQILTDYLGIITPDRFRFLEFEDAKAYR